MGKNIELAIMAALLVESGMLDDLKGMITAHRNNYNPAFARQNIRKIRNLKYSRHPVCMGNSFFYKNKG